MMLYNKQSTKKNDNHPPPIVCVQHVQVRVIWSTFLGILVIFAAIFTSTNGVKWV